MHVLNGWFDPESPVPLYHQVKEWMKGQIDRGVWPPERQIPPESQLAEMLGLGRNTVRRAILDLTREGHFYRRQGKGTFVSPPKVVQNLNRLYSFSRLMADHGHDVRDKLIEFTRSPVVPSSSVQRLLRIPDGKDVFEIKRLRHVDNEPTMIETTYLPAELCDGLTRERVERERLYALLAHFDLEPVRADEFFEPTVTDDYESGLLQVPRRSPALLNQRIAYDRQGRPVELSKSLLRGDRCRYWISLSYDVHAGAAQ